MAEVQTTYSESVNPGFPGMIANGEPHNVISRTCETAAGIGYGKAVYRGANDHGCALAQTLTGAGSEGAGNTGNGTITDAPTIGAGAKIGRYTISIVEPATNLGAFVIEDPDGINIGEGVVGTEYDADGLTFTIADGSTDFAAGDQLYIDVTGGAFLGISTARHGQGFVSGQDADEYHQYDNVGILTWGAIYVEAGETVVAGNSVFVDTDGNFVDSSGVPLPGWVFDEGGADGDYVVIVKR